MRPSVVEVAVSDPPDRWTALGFEVAGETVLLPGVRVVLQAPALSLAIDGVSELDELPVHTAKPPVLTPVPNHPNGAIGIDHVVALTPEFDRTVEALEHSAGLTLRRVIERRDGTRMGLRRLGPVIFELVEQPDAPSTAWWGLTVTVQDLGKLPADLITPPKPAVQPGRHIATARTPGTPLAFITAES